jgi:hypothetical protein
MEKVCILCDLSNKPLCKIRTDFGIQRAELE